LNKLVDIFGTTVRAQNILHSGSNG
jgi:hypothetical protein